MLCSPVATSKGLIDVVTNSRRQKDRGNNNGKAGGIDIIHFRSRFLERYLGFELGKDLSTIKLLNHPTLFISVRVTDCQVGQSGLISGNTNKIL